MRPKRQRTLVILLTLIGLASAILGALYLALWTDNLVIHHCNGWGSWPYGWDVFSEACGRPNSHLAPPELVIVTAPVAAAFVCFGAAMLSEGRRKIVMLPAVVITAATSLGSNWSYVFMPALAFDVAATLVAFRFNPAIWFWNSVSWRLRTSHSEM